MAALTPVRGLVISGGGAYGACGAGTLAALNRTYDLVSGVSTGSLMAPLVALREWERLRTAYTSVRQSDIFDINPFHSNGKIRVLHALWRIAQGKKTLGESNNLRKTIDQFIDDADFDELRAQMIDVFVASQETSYVPSRVHYFSSLTSLPEDFKDWLWTSANAPIVTSIVYKDFVNAKGELCKGEWTDGGVTELVSLSQMIRRGATEIDVILHRYERPEEYKGPVKDIFHWAFRLFGINRAEIEEDDLVNGLMLASLNGCVVNVYWLPHKLADNSLIFDPVQMSDWWDLGYRTANDPARIKRFDFITYPGVGMPEINAY